MKNNIRGVLFDLDGTLFDTAPDLVLALNHVREQYALPPLPFTGVRPYAGRGSRSLLQLAFQISESHPDYPLLSEQFLQYYRNNISHSTRLFPGMEEVFSYLNSEGLPWGIVTNKPTDLTIALLAALPLTSPPACVVCGDSLAKRKPHPEPIYHACQLLKLAPTECVYIGDTEVDVIASNAAGTRTLVALYGYTTEAETPSAWAADGYVSEPIEIVHWLQKNNH